MFYFTIGLFTGARRRQYECVTKAIMSHFTNLPLVLFRSEHKIFLCLLLLNDFAMQWARFDDKKYLGIYSQVVFSSKDRKM